MPALLNTSALVVGWTHPVTAPVTLSLKAGEILGITGPNGVGKSTFLAALAGQARIFSGAIEQRPDLQIRWQKQELPELHSLPLNGHDLLRLTGAHPEGLPDWLRGRLDMRLSLLSGGQRHYLALWTALAPEAMVYLLDEPTNNLDEAGCQHLGRTLKGLAAQGRSIVVVSHDQEFMTAICDRTQTLERPEPPPDTA